LEAALIERLRLAELLHALVTARHIVERGCNIVVIRNERFFEQAERIPEQRLSLLVASLGVIEQAEIAQGVRNRLRITTGQVQLDSECPYVDRFGLHGPVLMAVQFGDVVENAADALWFGPSFFSASSSACL